MPYRMRGRNGKDDDEGMVKINRCPFLESILRHGSLCEQGLSYPKIGVDTKKKGQFLALVPQKRSECTPKMEWAFSKPPDGSSAPTPRLQPSSG